MNPTARALQVLMALWLIVPASGETAASAPIKPAPYVPQQSDRPLPLTGEEPGFQPIFDGRTLAGWSGNPQYWRVEAGALVGEITAETVIKSNTFIIWQGAQPADFELKLEYRITADGNSGINYRSRVVPDPVTKDNAFAMRGYQLDLDGKNRYTGNNYEEKGRLFLALRGQMTRVVGGRPPILLSQVSLPADAGRAVTSDWTSVHLVARGPVLIHSINGQVMSVVMDDDATNRAAAGSLGVQVHVGPPMKVEYRNIRLKTFDSAAR